MSNPKPRVFIGSSGEGHEIAEAIQQNLDRAAEVEIWSQGVFGLSRGTLDNLVKAMPSFDFAILVLTPDDLGESRGASSAIPRDNVVFELGLFIGNLGAERTFIIVERGKQIKLPSDLAGITPADFERHSNGNLRSSLGAASTTIKTVIQQLGRNQARPEIALVGALPFNALSALLDIAALQFLILAREKNIGLPTSGGMIFGPRYEYDLGGRGRGNGLFSVGALYKKVVDAEIMQPDRHMNAVLTETGKRFADWLVANGHKAPYFSTEFGGWGSRPGDWKEA